MARNWSFSHIFMCVFLIQPPTTCGQTYNNTEIHNVFRDQFLNSIGNGTHIYEKKLQDFYLRHLWQPPLKSHVTDCLSSASTNEQCLLSTCLSPKDLIQISHSSSAGPADSELCTLSWILFHLSESGTCSNANGDVKGPVVGIYRKHPSKTEVWGFGFLCTTIIVLCAVAGMVALPFIRGVIYRKVLLFMVGLAVGTLAGSGLLVLAPEALGLTGNETDSDSYLWKCLTMVAAIYTFFLLEKALKLLTEMKQKKSDKKLQLQETEMHCNHAYHNGPADISNLSIEIVVDEKKKEEQSNGTIGNEKPEDSASMSEEKFQKKMKHIAPVAWMILLGDAVHNFIDGVSIGAAFTDSISAGVSVSVAVVCEELPHELGDFAVLLTAGMSKKRAALFNILSASTIYLGLIVGVFVGENAQAHKWVFAFAAGMFLYIALVDMMPELMAAAESEENKELVGSGMIFFLQNLGIVCGFGTILILAVFSGQLDKAIVGAGL